MPEKTTQVRDAKLVQYLAEAYGNEQRLETALEAHIALTTRDAYKRRLRQHLTETKRHARELAKRIKQLGGQAEATASLPAPLADAAGAVLSGAHKAAALAQGPLHALRGTGEAERQLKNAKTEYAEEAQEIAMYSAIETLGEAVGDKETVRLARAIRRDEQRMLTFLEREIPRLANAVVRAEIPAGERNGRRSARRSSRTRPARRKTTSRSGSTTGRRRTTTSASSRSR
jgi:ferritin-like metal-binding protein YciE